MGFILKIFLKFPKFQPRYSYRIYSYRKKGVYYEIFPEALPTAEAVSAFGRQVPPHARKTSGTQGTEAQLEDKTD